MKTIFGVFDTYEEAKQVVNRLMESGFSEEQMNLIVERGAVKQMIAERDFNRIKAEKSGELTTNPIRGLDAMLGGQQPVQIPDIGEVYASGELATLMTRTAAAPGATNDGLQSVLDEFGIPVEAAKEYVEEINSGGLLFFIRTDDDRSEDATELIQSASGSQVETFPR